VIASRPLPQRRNIRRDLLFGVGFLGLATTTGIPDGRQYLADIRNGLSVEIGIILV
jgi:hypothetical protein